MGGKGMKVGTGRPHGAPGLVVVINPNFPFSCWDMMKTLNSCIPGPFPAWGQNYRLPHTPATVHLKLWTSSDVSSSTETVYRANVISWVHGLR